MMTVQVASTDQQVVWIVLHSVSRFLYLLLTPRKGFRYSPITLRYLRTISILEAVCHLLTFARSEYWKKVQILRFSACEPFFFFYQQVGLVVSYFLKYLTSRFHQNNLSERRHLRVFRYPSWPSIPHLTLSLSTASNTPLSLLLSSTSSYYPWGFVQSLQLSEA